MSLSQISSSLSNPDTSCILCFRHSSLCFEVEELLYVICADCILSCDVKVLVVDDMSDTIIYCVLVVEGRHIVLFSGDDKPDFKAWAISVDKARQYVRTLKAGLRKLLLNSAPICTDLGETK